MCGRHYATYSDEELFLEYGNKRDWSWPLKECTVDCTSDYNTCPGQQSTILCYENSFLSFQSMRWGLVPSWASSVKAADKYAMINARAETIEEKKSFKEAFIKRRCILPVSGFYEWKKETSGKQPYAISMKKDSIMSIAGIYELWNAEGKTLYSYSIVTTEGNAFMQDIHHRMPVILSPEQEKIWIDPASNSSLLQECMIPCPSDILAAYPVSQAVNSPKNNTAEVLQPLS